MYDVVVVGAGIVGLTTARALHQAKPNLSIAIIDKESRIAAHQSSHNSGVIHSGIYYKPSSLKSQTVAAGRKQLIDFCDQHGIRYEICGKVIVATKPSELARLHALHELGEANKVAVTELSTGQLREFEPNASGVAALYVPSCGIADFPAVCDAIAAELEGDGVEILKNCKVHTARRTQEGLLLNTTRAPIETRSVVNCAGLHSDRVANMIDPGCTDVRIMGFRGEYYELTQERRNLIRNLIYPVPDPRFPFLGVHFTRMISGDVHAGPNAVVALAREGYSWNAFNIRDIGEVVRSRSSWTLFRKYWRTGAGELGRSLSKKAFVRGLQQLVPEVRSVDLVPSHAGVRAQAVTPDGRLLDDFAIAESDRAVHVVNAPSPAATASFEIGRIVATRALERLE